MNKKITYWALYDFANSLVSIAFLFYFSQWLVVDHGKPAWWYNAALVVSSALFILTAPYISTRIDEKRLKIGGLRFWTLLTFLSCSLTAILTMLTTGYELLATISYGLSLYAYLNCFLYYTPMLNDLSSDNNCSLVSGVGQSANSIGQVAAVLVTLPFVNGLTLFGAPGRAQALLPATVLFAIFALPMVLFYRERGDSKQSQAPAERHLHVFTLFKSVFSHRSLAFMLVAYFLFSDALLTFSNNFPLFLEQVFQVSDTTKSILTASILLLAAIGALIAGKMSRRLGGDVKVLNGVVTIWIALLLLMAMTTKFSLAVPIFLMAGLIFGPVWSMSRSLVGCLAPDNLVASSYSYYVVAERFATFIGPAVWSLTLVAFGENAVGYRAALVSLAVVLVISLFVLRQVADPARGLKS